MVVTPERLAEIADYCRIDADDLQLPSFAATAAAYLLGAGVSEPTDKARAVIYWQCVKTLTLDLYDRRDMTLDGGVTENPAFRRLLNQLKMTVPNSGTVE